MKLNFFTGLIKQLKRLGVDCIKEYKIAPSLLVVILPEGANELYTAVKQYVLARVGYCNFILISGSIVIALVT